MPKYLSPPGSCFTSPVGREVEAPLLPPSSREQARTPDAHSGPLMTLWRAQHANEDIPLVTLEAQRQNAQAQDDARRRTLRSQLRADAFETLSGLRRPLCPDMRANVATLQATLQGWDTLFGSERRHVVMLEGNVGLDCHGLGLVKAGTHDSECGREDRAAVRLGVLHASPQAFVSTVHGRLAALTERVALNGLAPEI